MSGQFGRPPAKAALGDGSSGADRFIQILPTPASEQLSIRAAPSPERPFLIAQSPAKRSYAADYRRYHPSGLGTHRKLHARFGPGRAKCQQSQHSRRTALRSSPVAISATASKDKAQTARRTALDNGWRLDPASGRNPQPGPQPGHRARSAGRADPKGPCGPQAPHPHQTHERIGATPPHSQETTQLHQSQSRSRLRRMMDARAAPH